MSEGRNDFLRVLVAWFLPPVGVWMQVGLKGAFWLNLLLSLCFWLPGVLHAVWVITHVGEREAPVAGGDAAFWRLVVAALFPPAAVFMKAGVGVPLVINLVLSFFFWVPGMIHAAWVVTRD